MSEVWTKYKAIVSYQGETRIVPVQAMSEHEAPDHARVMAGFEFGWDPGEVKVVSIAPDHQGELPSDHIHSYEVHLRPEGGEPEVFRLKARDAECAEGLAVLHCADRLGLDIREIDVLSVAAV